MFHNDRVIDERVEEYFGVCCMSGLEEYVVFVAITP